MNNIMKGSIAGAVGVAMLMGGFGSYALWSDSEDLAVQGVQSGELTIDTAAGQYDDANTGTAGDWTAGDKMVPGDKVTYTQVFTVTGSGKNLKGTISLATPAMSPNGFTTLVRSFDVVASGAGAADLTKSSATSFSFTKPFGSATLTATVTYELPPGATGLTDQNASATTPAAAFTIQQTP